MRVDCGGTGLVDSDWTSERAKASIMEEKYSDLCMKPGELIGVIAELNKLVPQEIDEVVKPLEPKTVALGFLHEPSNEEMEKQKIVYLRHLLVRGHNSLGLNSLGLNRLDSLTQAFWEKRSEVFGNSSDIEKIKVICGKGGSEGHSYTPKSAGAKIFIDTCFVLELILKCTDEISLVENDPIFLHGEKMQSIIHDMFLLSNQVPFFLLESFYSLIFHDGCNGTMKDVIASFMESELCIKPGKNVYGEPKHLCAAVYNLWVQDSYEFIRIHNEHGERRSSRRRRSSSSRRHRVIRHATELQRAGIGFKCVETQTFNLEFIDGVLEIPVLTITTETEHFLRQCIDYERNFRDNGMRIIKDYCVLMDCLIQSTKDVQLLREFLVIDSYLQNDQDIVDLFDRLGERVPSSTNFCYSYLFDQVNGHCLQRWNSWKANLRRNYFKDDNQVEIASFMIAIYIILPVTILQTVYTVLSYYSSS